MYYRTKNEHDEYAVAVVNDDDVVWYIPLRMSKIMSMFLKLMVHTWK